MSKKECIPLEHHHVDDLIEGNEHRTYSTMLTEFEAQEARGNTDAELVACIFVFSLLTRHYV